MARESEVKFSIDSPDMSNDLLRNAGGQLITPRTFEDNLLFEYRDGTLASYGILLRLRRYGDRFTLTLKKNPETEEGLKVRDEYETAVSDFDSTLEILDALGYHAVFRYQKYRTEWEIQDLHVCIDETPIGSYMEIEGDSKTVYDLAETLNLDHRTAITLSYIELFRITGGQGSMIFR